MDEVRTAYDALLKLRRTPDWAGVVERHHTEAIRAEHGVSFQTIQRAEKWHRLEDELDRAEDLHSVKEVVRQLIERTA